MTVVRWTNLICGALLIMAALAFLIFVPGNIADYAREPEDAWLGGFWIALLGLLVLLCFANAMRLTKPSRFGWLTLANAAAVVVLAFLLFLGRDDAAVAPLVAMSALGPVIALIAILRFSQVERS